MIQGWTAPLSLPPAPSPLVSNVHYPQCRSTDNQRGGSDCKCADAERMLAPSSPTEIDEKKKKKTKKKVVVVDDKEEESLQCFNELLNWIDWFQEENNLIVPANVRRNAEKLQVIIAELDKIIANGASHSSFIELYFMKREALIKEQSKTKRYDLIQNIISSYTT